MAQEGRWIARIHTAAACGRTGIKLEEKYRYGGLGTCGKVVRQVAAPGQTTFPRRGRPGQIDVARHRVS